MSERSGGNMALPGEDSALTDDELLSHLTLWGRLLETIVQGVSPFYHLEDLLQTDHPLEHSQEPLGSLVRSFGQSSQGRDFLAFWMGHDGMLPPILELDESTEPLDETQRARAFQLGELARGAFEAFENEWRIEPDGIARADKIGVAAVRHNCVIPNRVWRFIRSELGGEPVESEPAVGNPFEPQTSGLDSAIERVRSFFEPLESPLFGMDSELLAHHVKETIPRECPGETVMPIVPLFGGPHQHKRFPSSAQLPAHLRVILRRLETAQEKEQLVTALLATVESIDYCLRFATGLAQGCLATIEESDFPGPFNPTTREIVDGLSEVLDQLRTYWDHPCAQPAMQLLFQGQALHPFLSWAGFDSAPNLVDWMLSAEDSIAEDNPAQCAVLLSNVMENFNSWVKEFILLCSSWDVVTHTRQDGYLAITLGRGEVCVTCKPLVDPTRYSVWLDRSELRAVNSGEQLPPAPQPHAKFEPLDPRIMLCSNDPPFLSEQIGILLKAHDEQETLPLGRSLFFGIEYLVRLHASLAGGFLRHQFEESSLLDPVMKVGGALDHTVFFLAYSQRVLCDVESDEADLLREVFFHQGEPREFTRWLGLDKGVPGPLQGLLGWSLSLMRPDAGNRLDEIRGQVERLSGMFADFVEASRALWSKAPLRIDPSAEGAEAVVVQFPSGLSLRGLPDVVVGPRLEPGRRSVVVGLPVTFTDFSDWETEDGDLDLTESGQSSPVEENAWPSFFEEPSLAESGRWSEEDFEAVSELCVQNSFAGPRARPRAVAGEIANHLASVGAEESSLCFVRGDRGSGRTFLCRTLTNVDSSPLPEDFPVLYLRIDRFPETRLSTVVERLNDHIAAETSLDKFGWIPVPIETLQALGSEVDRLSAELRELGQGAESLACRLSSYLRYLKKLNDGRDFLLILDGFEEVPESIVPRALSPGVHLMITGSSFPQDLETTPYVRQQFWDLTLEETSLGTFAAQLSGMDLQEEEEEEAFHRLQGSILKARAYLDLGRDDPHYQPQSQVIEDVILKAKGRFSEPERYQDLLCLLSTLGLYERPVPLKNLQTVVSDGKLVLEVTRDFPSLFSFWEHPEPALALSHRSVLEMLVDQTEMVEEVALSLARQFLDAPRRGDLMPALRWFRFSGRQGELAEEMFNTESVSNLWREELSHLWEKHLYFQRVALLDATAEPLMDAIERGAGHLREELAWLHNARGLSLLELGLIEEASEDFQTALAQFQAQFAEGDTDFLTAIASANNRLSEAALREGDLERASVFSQRALSVLEEARGTEAISDPTVLTARVLAQNARVKLQSREHDSALEDADKAVWALHGLEPAHSDPLQGLVSRCRAEALCAIGQLEAAAEELETAVDLLFTHNSVDDGLQALLLRSRVQAELGHPVAAFADQDRAVSLLRLQVAMGRLDLEDMLAYAASQRALTGSDDAERDARSLSEFVEWARKAIRYEGRSEVRALLAYLYLCRGESWKKAGEFARAVEDLRCASEQYDILSTGLGRFESEAVFNALGRAFTNMTVLYLGLDEAHLALMCGRRALELGRHGGWTEQQHDLDAQTLQLPRLSDQAILKARQSGVYQNAKLNFHLGEATRRLRMFDFSGPYFERSARGFAQLQVTSREPLPDDKLEEYALALKYAARSALERQDFSALNIWIQQLRNLPNEALAEYDRFTLHNWAGQSLAAQREYKDSYNEFQLALQVLGRLRGHPRENSLKAETLLELGRVQSLMGEHENALQALERAAMVARNALFVEGEENRELLVRSSFHCAVAYLRAGQQDEALDQLRILVSFRPGSETGDLNALAEDWVEAWRGSAELPVEQLLGRLGQMCELGDWLMRTALGLWFRDLVSALVNNPAFEEMEVPSAGVDQLLETFLVVSFSHARRPGPISETVELHQLLRCKLRAMENEDRLVEAELALSHLLPARRSPKTGPLLLRRSEMALLRGDRGLAILDLMQAIEGRGSAKVSAHLRLSEFLLSRELKSAAADHLRQAVFSLDEEDQNLPAALERIAAILDAISVSGPPIDPAILETYLRTCRRIPSAQGRPDLSRFWIGSLNDYQQWDVLSNLTVSLLREWQLNGIDQINDWYFLEEVMERALLWSGVMEGAAMERLGQLLATAKIRPRHPNLHAREALWAKYLELLPVLGRQESLAQVRRLFEVAQGTDNASTDDGLVAEFLRQLEAEKRLLSQPR